MQSLLVVCSSVVLAAKYTKCDTDHFQGCQPLNQKVPDQPNRFIDYFFLNFYMHTVHFCGPGSSVGIATDYGLDGPGFESQWCEIFRPSRPVLGPTQPPVQ